MARHKPARQTFEPAPDSDLPAGPVDIYANSVQIISTAYDVLFEFSVNTPVGVITPDTQNFALERSNICRVRMSPQHAKSVLVILLQQVTDYEKKFGKLGLDPDNQAKWEAARQAIQGA